MSRGKQLIGIVVNLMILIGCSKMNEYQICDHTSSTNLTDFVHAIKAASQGFRKLTDAEIDCDKMDIIADKIHCLSFFDTEESVVNSIGLPFEKSMCSRKESDSITGSALRYRFSKKDKSLYLVLFFDISNRLEAITASSRFVDGVRLSGVNAHVLAVHRAGN